MCCTGGDWCTYNDSVGKCMRATAEQISILHAKPCRSGGYIFRIPDGIKLPPLPKQEYRAVHKNQAAIAQFAEECYRRGKGHLKELSDILGVSQAALDALYVGFGTGRIGRFWTFPERDITGKIIGITRRLEHADDKGRTKLCVRDSKRGLSYPLDWKKYPSPLIICEGGTDCSTALTMGIGAFGKPNNTGGGQLLAALLHDATYDLVIVGENDKKDTGQWPGKEGAESTAHYLRQRLKGRRIVIRYPRTEFKDLREEFRATGVDANNAAACRRVGQSFLRRWKVAIADEKAKVYTAQS
jgi:hypothetical protein